MSGLTVGVSSRWAGQDSPSKREKLKARIKAKKNAARTHLSTARIVSPPLVIQHRNVLPTSMTAESLFLNMILESS
jgi:hypothetical protein